MVTITKRFNNYAFAHRQDSHKGKEANVHGHNWDFEIVLGASELDENGSVFDHRMDIITNHFSEVFDHTLVLNQGDPLINVIQANDDYFDDVFDGFRFPAEIRIVDDCSPEGLAKNIFEFVDGYVKAKTNGRVECLTVTVFEDAENSAAFHNA